MKSFCFLLLFSGFLLSQKVEAQWRILYKSDDVFMPNDTARTIETIYSRGTLSKYIVIRYTDKTKALVAKKDIWGYVDENKEVWRVYQKECYHLVSYNGGWAKYTIGRPMNTRGSFNLYNMLVYSRTLDSSIYSSWTQAMADAPPSYILR